MKTITAQAVPAQTTNYCFKCGSYTRIDEHSKLCDGCYEDWRTGVTS